MIPAWQWLKSRIEDSKPVDYFLSKSISRQIQGPHPEWVFWSSLMLSKALSEGQTCLSLSHLEKLIQDGVSRVYEVPPSKIPSQAELFHLFQDLQLQTGLHPMVLFEDKLYFRKFWSYEREIETNLKPRITSSNSDLNTEAIKATLDTLFPAQTDANEIDWQKVAVAAAIKQNFLILAGGPGTGKTTTITKLIAALQILVGPLSIALAAPTGKAAMRMIEAIQFARKSLVAQQLISSETANSIPDQAFTLHRLLGYQPGKNRFKFNQDNPLEFDLLVIDEASMVDQTLMARFLRALPQHARLVLLGDPNQLPSVSPGNVLGDLSGEPPTHLSSDLAKTLRAWVGYDLSHEEGEANQSRDYVIWLEKSHRFHKDSPIGQLARDVLAGNAKQSWQQIETCSSGLFLVPQEKEEIWFESLIQRHYEGILKTTSLEKAFEILEAFRILALTNKGPNSVENLNLQVRRYFESKKLVPRQVPFFHGQPIMVTENHYDLELYNGDTGLIWKGPDSGLQAVFRDSRTSAGKDSSNSQTKEGFRFLSPSKIPNVQTVFAMTIHKTQGSEFDHIALVLPRSGNQLLSRQLLYTAITRARSKFELLGQKEIWFQAVQSSSQRISGLTGI